MTEKFRGYSSDVWASPVALTEMNLPAMPETWI